MSCGQHHLLQGYVIGLLMGVTLCVAWFPSFGAFVCWLRRRHRWGRISLVGCVTCRRCGHFEVSA